MVKVGKKDIKVSVVRKILSSFNKAVKEDAIIGIWGMKTPELQKEMEKFKLDKDGNVKHRFKAKDWRYDFKETDVSKGRVKKTAAKPAAKKPPKKKKQKAQTAQDEEDESKGMKGQVKGTTSKTAPKNFEKKKKKKKKVDVGAALDAFKEEEKKTEEGKKKKETAYQMWVRKKGGVSKVKKGEWAKSKDNPKNKKGKKK